MLSWWMIPTARFPDSLMFGIASGAVPFPKLTLCGTRTFSETGGGYEPNAVTEIGSKASRDRVREFIHQGETLRVIVVLSAQKQNPVTPLAFDVFMPRPMRELFGDIRGRLHTPVVWNAVTRQNDPISTAFAFCHFLNIARSRHRSRNLPFSRHMSG
jgi:hypothetical protein